MNEKGKSISVKKSRRKQSDETMYKVTAQNWGFSNISEI